MSDIPLKILALGDLHFGKLKLNPIQMYESLCQNFLPRLETTDMVVIVGDYFDTLLDFTSIHAVYALKFFTDLVEACHKYQIILRIVNGTFSHDRNQTQALSALIDKSDRYRHTLNFSIASKIQVETISVRGIEYNLGYLPDSLPFKDGNQVSDIFSGLLTEMQWSKLDVLFGHGTFDYTLPVGIVLPACTYTLPMFQNITDLMIMGHIHIASHRGYVYYTGSYDRMTHGEEEPKGYLQIEKTKTSAVVKRIINTNSQVFKTYSTTGTDPYPEELDRFQKWLESHVPKTGNSYLRIQTPTLELRALLSNAATDIIPGIYITTDSNSPRVSTGKTLTDYQLEVGELVVPTEDNLPKLVLDVVRTVDPSYTVDWSEDTTKELLSQYY